MWVDENKKNKLDPAYIFWRMDPAGGGGPIGVNKNKKIINKLDPAYIILRPLF